MTMMMEDMVDDVEQADNPLLSANRPSSNGHTVVDMISIGGGQDDLSLDYDGDEGNYGHKVRFDFFRVSSFKASPIFFFYKCTEKNCNYLITHSGDCGDFIAQHSKIIEK